MITFIAMLLLCVLHLGLYAFYWYYDQGFKIAKKYKDNPKGFDKKFSRFILIYFLSTLAITATQLYFVIGRMEGLWQGVCLLSLIPVFLLGGLCFSFLGAKTEDKYEAIMGGEFLMGKVEVLTKCF